MKTKSGFASVHPFVSFIYFIGVFLFIMLFSHPLFLGTALIFTIIQNLIADRGKQLRKVAMFYMVMGLFIIMINPLFSHRGSHILFYFLDQPITLEAVLYGITMMFSIVSLMIGFQFFNQIITEDKLMYLFSSIAPKAALLTIMAIRFVPLLKRRLGEISNVQRTKGITVDQGSFFKRAKHGMQLLHILFTWSLEEALQTAESMRARGYGLKKRTSYFTYKMDTHDWLLLSTILTIEIITLLLAIRGYGMVTIYPRLEALQLSTGDLLTFGIFLSFLAIPIFIEGREILRWRDLKYKM